MTKRIDQLIVAAVLVVTTAAVVIGLMGAAEARPTNTGDTISGCTYCHTGRIPPPPTTAATTTTSAQSPEDESSDGFIIRRLP